MNKEAFEHEQGGPQAGAKKLRSKGKEAVEQGQGGGGAGCASLGKHLFGARQTPDVVTEVSLEITYKYLHIFIKLP